MPTDDQVSNLPDVQLFLDGRWVDSADRATRPVIDPSTGSTIGQVAWAAEADLEATATAARSGFDIWRAVPAYEPSKVLRSAASLLRTRAADIARRITLEQGKTLAEASAEVQVAADTVDWFAEEGRRTSDGSFRRARPERSKPC